MNHKLKKGDNRLIERVFFDQYGAKITYANMTAITATFKQGSETVISYSKADVEVREGDKEYEIEVELTESVSNTLTIGKPLSILYKITVTDTDFDSDGSRIFSKEYQVAETVY